MALTIKNSKLKTTFTYTPVSEIGEAKPFSIKFDVIPLDTLASLQDAALSVSQSGEYNISINSLNYKVIKTALSGWSNIEDDNGPVRFKSDQNGATDSSLQLLPGDIRSEIATVVIECSKDLPNAETYLKELSDLAKEGIEEDEEVEEVKAKPKRTKKAE